MEGPKDTRVYVAREGDNLVGVYTGITKQDVLARQAQHGALGRKWRLDPIADQQFSRSQARAIEQAIMENNPSFINQYNSIDPSHSWYLEAVQWGEEWLKANAAHLLQG
jgi:hypothetical protein